MDAPILALPLAALLLAVVLPAQAGEIHRCRGADGTRVFQDQPCAPGVQSLGVQVVDVAPAPASSPARRAQREEAARIAAWERESRARLAPSLGGRAAATGARGATPRPAPAPRAAPDACATARARREAAYRSDGNRMGFDRRRALQDAVIAACGLR